MATILWGHGARTRGDEKTFVPDGVTIKWYAEVDRNMAATNGFFAIELGAIGAFGAPTDQQGPGNGTEVKVYNYRVSPAPEDREGATLLNRGSPHVLRFVGEDVKDGYLCNDVSGCEANGSHNCDGVFGQHTLVWGRDPQLILLVCRGLSGARMTMKFGSDRDDPLTYTADAIDEVAMRLIEQAATDPEGAEKVYDAFPPKSKAYASGTKIAHWLAVRRAADFGRKGQIPDLFKELAGVLDSDVAVLLADVPRYGDGFTAAAVSKPEEFFTTLDSLPGDLPETIAGIPGVAAARDQFDAKAEFASEDWEPDEEAMGGAEFTNGENLDNLPADGASVYAGGVMMLIGGDHDLRAQAYVDRQPDRERGSLVMVKGAFKTCKVSGIVKTRPVVEELLTELLEDEKVKIKFE